MAFIYKEFKKFVEINGNNFKKILQKKNHYGTYEKLIAILNLI